MKRNKRIMAIIMTIAMVSDIGKSASDQYQSKGSSDTTGRKYEGYKHIDGKGR